MRVIAKPILIDFWTRHPRAQVALSAWYRIMLTSTFSDFNQLRKVFPSADYVSPFTVFNIAGNHFRLVCVIHYNRAKVFVRHILTHAEYDRGNWRKTS